MAQKKRMGTLLCLAVFGLFSAASCLAEQTGSIVESLIGGSDFVGFVQAQAEGTVPDSPWKKRVTVFTASPLKGIMMKDAGFHEFPSLWGDGPEVMRLPDFYAEKGEYLVFLREVREKTRKHWITLAAFRVEYRADIVGNVVGYMTGDASLDRDYRVASATGPIAASFEDDANRPRLPRPASEPVELTAVRARQCLQTILDGKGDVRNAARTLDRFVVQAVIDNTPAARAQDVTFEQMFRRAQRLAAGVRIGSARADVEKIFPRQDGGLCGPDNTRYVIGAEVMVEVPYDGTWVTGVYSGNRVAGPLRIYRSYGHID